MNIIPDIVQKEVNSFFSRKGGGEMKKYFDFLTFEKMLILQFAARLYIFNLEPNKMLSIVNLDDLRNLVQPNPWKSHKYISIVGKHQKCSFLKILKHQNCL